jgi:hypothetical protein
MMMSGLYGDPSNACTATSGWQMNIVGKLQRALFVKASIPTAQSQEQDARTHKHCYKRTYETITHQRLRSYIC